MQRVKEQKVAVTDDRARAHCSTGLPARNTPRRSQKRMRATMKRKPERYRTATVSIGGKVWLAHFAVASNPLKQVTAATMGKIPNLGRSADGLA